MEEYFNNYTITIVNCSVINYHEQAGKKDKKKKEK